MPPPARGPDPASGFVPARVRWLLACCLGIAVATLAGEAKPTHGVFPGANGSIAFQSFRGGSSQIYLKTRAADPVRRLTDPRHCYALPPGPPNGRWIASSTTRARSGCGRRERHLGDEPRRAAAVDDGEAADQGARLRRRPLLVAQREADRVREHPERRPGRWVMNADGTTPRPHAQHPGFDGDPAWSPGGSRTPSPAGGTQQGDLSDEPGQNRGAEHTNNRADDFDPTWSPDGQLVGFVSNHDRNDEIYETNDRFCSSG